MNQYKKIFKENLINKKYFFIGIIIVYFFLTFSVVSKESNYFSEGIKLYNKKEFSKSKVFFEKDIVFNPKQARSYLYLAKIYNFTESETEEEKNLNTVLLLDPKNEEGTVMMIELKLKNSDFSKVENLLTNFEKICKDLCYKKKDIKNKLKLATTAEAN